MFEVRDYVNVCCYQLPPVYVLSTVTRFTAGNGIVRYHKLFYDVCAEQHNGQITNYRFLPGIAVKLQAHKKRAFRLFFAYDDYLHVSRKSYKL